MYMVCTYNMLTFTFCHDSCLPNVIRPTQRTHIQLHRNFTTLTKFTMPQVIDNNNNNNNNNNNININININSVPQRVSIFFFSP